MLNELLAVVGVGWGLNSYCLTLGLVVECDRWALVRNGSTESTTVFVEQSEENIMA
jgi:hypothetical protein